MDPVTLGVFVFVYAGMIAGGIRGLALDRTGIVLVGAIVLIVTGRIGLEDAWRSADLPTLALLFGLMVVSAQMRLGGFYSAATLRLTQRRARPPALLAEMMVLAAALSSVLSNDVVCLAVTPLLIAVCSRRGLAPLPHLLGLACASNIGSAATLIGNPQNMLIGQTLDLSFARHAMLAAAPSLLSLLVAWAWIAWLWRGKWEAPPEAITPMEADPVPFNRWQSFKGLIVLGVAVALFLLGQPPREVVALGAAALLLLSRRLASSRFLALVDWNLLLLFLGLFVINEAVAVTGAVESAAAGLGGAGISLEQPGWLIGITAGLSNLVSNVPAVMLLLQALPGAGESIGLTLTLASTFAGNFILVGSLANIIVAEQAGRLGGPVTARTHARVGIPITLVTLVICWGWVSWLRL